MQARQFEKKSLEVRDKIFVALDVDSPEKAIELARALSGQTRMFKVGSKLFTAAGPDLVRKLVGLGARVFLDLKFHDIPATVAAASVEATRLGVFLFTIHASGGTKMMAEAIQAASAEADRLKQPRPLIVGVTVLTSLDSYQLNEIGVTRTLPDQVASLSRLSATAGLDGVVASPHEVHLIREAVDKPDFVVVTPGVRPLGGSKDDQSRVMTPAEAIGAGATYLVIGRPVIASNDPVEALKLILDEIKGSFT